MTSNESGVTTSWKQPWSLNEIITHSNNWSLAGDSGVCELLKRFSSDLITDVTQVSYNLSELQIESKQLNVVMENVSNDLCMLANDQFIENLVEEVHDTGYEKVSNDVAQSSKEDKGAHTVSLVLQALRMGLQVLDNQFDVIDVPRMGSVSQNYGESDFESQTVHSASDFPTNEPIYQPKDPYENRHLPHLIGTADFIEDDTLGIGFIDDVEEVPALSADSVSETSSLQDVPRQDFLTSSSDSDDNLDDKPVTKTDNRGPVSVESDEDMFDSEPKAETSKPVETVEVQETRPLNPTEQLNKQLKARLSIGSKPSDVIADKSEEPLAVVNELVIGNIDEEKPTASRSSLWDNDENEEEDDDDIFAFKPTNSSKVFPSLGKQSSSSVVKPSTEPDKKSSTIDNRESQPKVSNVKPSVPVEDDTESEDDLFGPSKLPKKKEAPIGADLKKKASTMSAKTDGSFDSSSNKAKTLQNGGTKAKIMSRSVNKESSITKRPTTVMNPFHFSSDDEEYDDLFKPAATKKDKVSATKPVASTRSSDTKELPKKTPVAIDKRVSDSSDSDGLFGDSSSKKPSVTPANKVLKEPPVTKPVAATRSSDANELPKTSDKRMSDNSDSDELFDKPSPLAPANKVVKEQSVTKPVATTRSSDTKELPKTTLLTSDKRVSDSSDSDELFDKPSSKKPSITPFNKVEKEPSVTKPVAATRSSDANELPKKAPVAIDKRMSDSSDSDGLFGEPFSKKPSVAPVNKVVKEESRMSSGDSDFDIFGSKSHPVVSTEASLRKKADSPIIGKKVTANNDPLSVDTNNSSRTNNGPSVIGKPVLEPTKVDPQPQSSSLNVSNDSEEHSIVDDTADKPRPSMRSVPIGGVSMFGGSKSNNNSSIIDEMNKRIRESKANLRQNLVSDNDDNSEEEKEEKKSIARDVDVPVTRLFQLPNMVYKSKEDSPMDETQINIDAPVHAVNQLNHLTKSNIRVTRGRRPATKKTETTKEEVTVIQPFKEEVKVVEPPKEEVKVVETHRESTIVPVSHGDTDPRLSLDNDDIFANLPPTAKKTKSKKKESAKSRESVKPVEVDVNEIDDIFAVATTNNNNNKGTAKKTKTKTKTSVAMVVDDPLGAL